jgi:hypothetical protein
MTDLVLDPHLGAFAAIRSGLRVSQTSRYPAIICASTNDAGPTDNTVPAPGSCRPVNSSLWPARNVGDEVVAGEEGTFLRSKKLVRDECLHLRRRGRPSLGEENSE